MLSFAVQSKSLKLTIFKSDVQRMYVSCEWLKGGGKKGGTLSTAALVINTIQYYTIQLRSQTA